MDYWIIELLHLDILRWIWLLGWELRIDCDSIVLFCWIVCTGKFFVTYRLPSNYGWLLIISSRLFDVVDILGWWLLKIRAVELLVIYFGCLMIDCNRWLFLLCFIVHFLVILYIFYQNAQLTQHLMALFEFAPTKPRCLVVFSRKFPLILLMPLCSYIGNVDSRCGEVLCIRFVFSVKKCYFRFMFSVLVFLSYFL